MAEVESGDRVRCPRCGHSVQLLRISKAVALANVTRQTVSSYIDEGTVYTFKVAGTTLRLCPGCLLATVQIEQRAVVYHQTSCEVIDSVPK